MEDKLLPFIEALIFAAEQALPIIEIQKRLSVFLDFPVTENMLIPCLDRLQSKYDQKEFTFCIRKSGGGYQFFTKPEFHELVTALNGEKFTKKLSATSMETLSIIAYKQPITKGDIEFIRGVSSDYSIQKLLEKELIFIQGRKEDAIGKPLLYATTPYFMDYLGINDVAELPRLKEIVQIMPVEGTDGKDAEPETINISRTENNN